MSHVAAACLRLARVDARRQTDQLKRELTALWGRLLALHDGEAHVVLGYASWHAYCEAEFGLGKSQCYRLLDAGRVAAVVPQLGNEAQARELVPLLREQGADAVRALVDELVNDDRGLTARRLRDAVTEQVGVSAGADANTAPETSGRANSRLGVVAARISGHSGSSKSA